MRAADIRSRFLAYFERQGHLVRPSSSLVPADDPTLLFTNAGMVPFKKVFLGLEEPPDPRRRATTAQKCVRAGGKHNDLEQVGHTARHHTFFEMLGNFSFGDYFKRDAIRFAWEFVTGDPAEGNLGVPKEHLRVTVFHEDDEARGLWQEVTGIAPSRVYGLGERDNFWQMADTGPCGPCTEIYVDLAAVARDFRFPEGATGEWTEVGRDEYSLDAFVEGAEAGRFLEIWNLVFMQYDRQPDGTLVPLPRPSVDTGAGLERIAAVLQGVTNNFHTDAFAPLLAEVEAVVGAPYRGRESDAVVGNNDPAGYRVLADHARAVAFLLADGVFPSNEGRGYVLRRILRRAVRHAYLLGRTSAPTLHRVVERVVETMGDAYPELRQRAQHIAQTTRAEEERFLATIEGGMARFDEIAPARTTQGSTAVRGTVAGEDAFRLYDTFGFPIDLTELMARERGYTVDVAGFEAALGRQRAQSQDERKSRKLGVAADALGDLESWERDGVPLDEAGRFVGYEAVRVETEVAAVKRLDGGRVAVLLRETPFYAESGGQVSDRGEIVGAGWRVDVDEVRKIEGRVAALGALTGELAFGPALARVPTDRRRDTERNHTATHLLHAALRQTLGEHVHQAGSVVEPDRLRFDFTHHGPLRPEPARCGGADGQRRRVGGRGRDRDRAAVRGGGGGGCDGALRREVRRRGAGGRHPRPLDGAVRRHARAQHGGDRALPRGAGDRRGRGRPPHHGRDRPQGLRAPARARAHGGARGRPREGAGARRRAEGGERARRAPPAGAPTGRRAARRRRRPARAPDGRGGGRGRRAVRGGRGAGGRPQGAAGVRRRAPRAGARGRGRARRSAGGRQGGARGRGRRRGARAGPAG
jgi:alanyl-tRNA synthetase